MELEGVGGIGARTDVASNPGKVASEIVLKVVGSYKVLPEASSEVLCQSQTPEVLGVVLHACFASTEFHELFILLEMRVPALGSGCCGIFKANRASSILSGLIGDLFKLQITFRIEGPVFQLLGKARLADTSPLWGHDDGSIRNLR